MGLAVPGLAWYLRLRSGGGWTIAFSLSVALASGWSVWAACPGFPSSGVGHDGHSGLTPKLVYGRVLKFDHLLQGVDLRWAVLLAVLLRSFPPV